MEGAMTELRKKKCTPCEGGIPPMTLEEAEEMQKQVPAWEVIDDGQALRRLFNFKDHYEVMAFVNAIAWISHRENHHPSLEVGYSRCEVVYSTHAVEGLTENDFICAAKIDALLE
jgi:4a-hydroxytetrahydrobiopterin dehydratase